MTYLEFLFSLITDKSICSPLLKYLYEVDYIWTVPLDKNRAQDGIDLRCLYANLYHLTQEQYDAIFGTKPCSMLEMLIGLAQRIENDFMADRSGNKTPMWFFMMIDNLGLSNYLTCFNQGAVDHQLIAFFDHQIGLFGLTDRNILSAQLWDQLNVWLIQNN